LILGLLAAPGLRGAPGDTDDDGLPDTTEDANGNLIKDASETDFQDADTDDDGQNDGEETAAGTNPLNDQSVQWKSLASWRFADGTFNGLAGQTPLAQTRVTLATGYEDQGANFPKTNQPVQLQYKGIEGNARANVSLKRGSIRFRLRTFWFSNNPINDYDAGGGNIYTYAGSGPGEWITLVQASNFALRIDPDGTNIVLTSETLAGGTMTNIYAEILVESDNARPSKTTPGRSFWHDVLLTYSPEGTSITFEAGAFANRLTGPGIAALPNLSQRNATLNFGSAADGTGSINSTMDDIATFNAVGVQGTNAWRMSAAAGTAPPSLNLMWVSATNLLSDIQRREAGGGTWSWLEPAFGTNYSDKAVDIGKRYEYEVNTGYAAPSGIEEKIGQYVTAAVAGEAIESRGKLILLVDETMATPIQADLNLFITNLVGDGWQILRKDVPRHINDYSLSTSYLTNHYNITNHIAPFIRSNYTQFTTNIKYIVIVGHVTVPYTGTFADDGHYSPGGAHGAHQGAWSADNYYGDVDGNWTDALTITGSSYAFNKNYPNDGRFDQDYIPANGSGEKKLEIPVARIDFSRLANFSDSEAVLLGKYFKKNGDYRNGARTFLPQAMAAEYSPFPTIIPQQTATELVSKSAPLAQTQIGDVFTSTASFLFGVQSGPGFFDRINDAFANMHTTQDFANGTTTTNCAFYYLRGSYFPDWNTENNLLRGLLGTANGGLGAVATFRAKSWRGDGLAVGLSIGNEMRTVVNEVAVNGWIFSSRYIQFLGDATLRYPVLPPPVAVTRSITNNKVALHWAAPAGLTPLYHVYRSAEGILGEFTRLTPEPITATSYIDATPTVPSSLYMIRALQPVTTGGGTFTNISQGIFFGASIDADACCILDQTINEDGTTGAISFSIGSADGQPGLSVTAASTDNAVLPPGNIVISGSGPVRGVTATPAAQESGAATVIIRTQWDADTNYQTFLLTVNAVNDAPSFTKGANLTVAMQAGPKIVSNWATALSAGPANEAGQALSFELENDKPFLFSTQPEIDPTGELSYAPAQHQRGTANLTVRLRDDGGTANSGQDLSAGQAFTITLGQAADSDGDGLPNDFEDAYSLNPSNATDAGTDWDGDGFSALEELWSATNPQNSRSAMRVTDVAVDGSGASLSINSAFGRAYSIEANDAFPSGGWGSLASGLIGNGGALNQADAGAASQPRRVYRIATSNGGGTEVVSEFAGFQRITLQGASDTQLAMPFPRPAAELGAVSAVSGNIVTLRGPAAWTANQWVYSSPTRTNTHYLLIRSGNREGDFYTITSNDTSRVFLDLQGENLSGVVVGNLAAIVPYWTLGTIFPGGQGVHSAPAPGNRRTELLIPDLTGNGINLSAARTYYFWNGAWRQVGQGTTIKNDDVILPDMYFWVRHNLASNTELIAKGGVLHEKWRFLVRRSPSIKQDNLFALPRPAPVTLADSGLISSGAFRASAGPGSRIDELLVFDNSTVSKNKSAAGTYYYWNNAWRKVGAGAADKGADVVFNPGQGVILRAGTNVSSVTWTNAPTY